VRTLLALIFAVMLYTSGASAQDAAAGYPNRPIRIIVCVPAGGGVDTVTRIVANGLQQRLGQPVVVENRAGAGGNIGAEAVFTADPDGYTPLAAQPAPLTVNPLLYSKMTFDPERFEPVTIMTSIANVLLVRPDFPAKTPQEFIAYAKANPGKLNYSTPGIGTPPHLIGEMLKQRAGVEIVHVPYKSGGQSIQAVVAGEVQLTFENPAVALPLVQAGVVRALAVTSEARHPQAPDVPTVVEAGLPDFVSVSFTGVVGPAGIAGNIVAKLNSVINESLQSPDVAATLTKLAVDVQPGTPAQFATFLSQEMTEMTPVVKAAGLQGVQ